MNRVAKAKKFIKSVEAIEKGKKRLGKEETRTLEELIVLKEESIQWLLEVKKRKGYESTFKKGKRSYHMILGEGTIKSKPDRKGELYFLLDTPISKIKGKFINEDESKQDLFNVHKSHLYKSKLDVPTNEIVEKIEVE